MAASSAAATCRYPRVILATGVVPWREDDTSDEPLFRHTIRHLVPALTRHLYVFGTAGEGYAVSDRQFADLTRAFVEEMNATGGVPMVGVISLSLATVIERIELARGLGVEEIQISLPCWGALSDSEVDCFFQETCGRFPDLRFLHYNVARAKRQLTGADYGRLAPRHPNLVAIKMGGDTPALLDVARGAPALRCFFTEPGYLNYRQETDCGLLCALGLCDPALARRLFDAGVADRAKLAPVFRAIREAIRDALAGSGAIDGAYDKCYVKRLFPEFPLRLLPPYAGATEEQFSRFLAGCDAALAAVPDPSEP
jgi:dihydrodipicolinate synthase/N-acetylneuraminate lyase